MQDRVSLYPGRVKLVPVAGQENTYDMVRADSPTQEGTPLNKDSLLKDATAALYGLGADAVPDNVLALLKTLVDNAQASADGKVQIKTGSYVGTGTYGVDNPNQIVLPFPPQFFAIIPVTGSQNKHYAVIGIPGALSLRYNAYTGSVGEYTATNIKAIGNVLQWYTATNAAEQLNYNGATYKYVVFG